VGGWGRGPAACPLLACSAGVSHLQAHDVGAQLLAVEVGRHVPMLEHDVPHGGSLRARGGGGAGAQARCGSSAWIQAAAPGGGTDRCLLTQLFTFQTNTRIVSQFSSYCGVKQSACLWWPRALAPGLQTRRPRD
jgi:hypothetical protein